MIAVIRGRGRIIGGFDVPNLTCAHCGDAFAGSRRNQKYCSSKCRNFANSLRRGDDCSVCGKRMHRSSTKARVPTCNACRTANPDGSVKHGNVVQYKKGCRCQECKDGMAVRAREYAARYKSEHGYTPSKRWKRERRGVPVEDQICVKCGEPLKTSYFHEGVEPMHKGCRGLFYVADSMRLAIHERDSWNCHLCGQQTNRSADVYDDHYPTLDHVIPKSMGGLHTMDNLKTACRRCNLVRGVRPIDKWEAPSVKEAFHG